MFRKILGSLILIFVVLGSASLVYTELRYPNYGLFQRFRISWKILSSKNWHQYYQSEQALEQKIKNKTQELLNLERSIQTKNQQEKRFEQMEQQIKNLEQKLKEYKKS